MTRRILSAALRGGCMLLFASLLTCGRAEVSVAVNLPALPTDTLSIDAILKLDGRQVGIESFTQELDGAGPRLGFKLPAGTRGLFEVELLAKNKNGCVISRALLTVELTADKVQTIDAAFGKLPAPVISQVSQRYLRNNQDVSLTLTGENLYACSKVQVGNQDVKDLQVLSTTQMSLTVPARQGTCGPASIKVTGSDGQITLRDNLLSFYSQTPKFGPAITLSAPNTSSELLLEDFTGDHELDIVILGSAASLQPKLLVGRGDGSFASPVNVPLPVATVSFTAHITAGDVNGDGLIDLLYTCPQTTPAKVERVCVSLQGGGTLKSAVSTDVAIQAVKLNVGDIDGDNKPDLVSTHGNAPPYQVGVLRGNGDGTFDATGLTASLFGSATGRLDAIALADFNRDGKLDVLGLLTYTPPKPWPGMQLALGNGNRTFAPFTSTSACNEAYVYGVGDANGDKNPDIFIGNTLCTGDGGTGFKEQAFFFTGGVGSPSIVDINGDGLMDVAVLDEDSQNIATRLRNSDGTYRTGPSVRPTSPVNTLNVGDLNGDGIADLVSIFSTPSNLEVRLGECN